MKIVYNDNVDRKQRRLLLWQYFNLGGGITSHSKGCSDLWSDKYDSLVISEQCPVNSSLRDITLCHPELVSGSSHSKTLGNTQKEKVVASTMGQMPKQVRHDKVCRDSKAAFTLAEVLITLGIIGVVAAMTLPTLIQNHQKQVLLSQLKKEYAVLNQAVQLMKAEYDNVDPVQMPFVHKQWDHKAYLDSSLFGPEFAKYIPVDWHRADPSSRFCFDTDEDYNYKYSNNSASQARYIMTMTANNYTWQLKDGACVEFAYGSNWEWDGRDKRRFIIDVNGSYKNPNVIGKDIYYFEFLPDGRILPYGFEKTGTQQLDNCKSSGMMCAALLLSNGWAFPKNYPWK